MSQPWYAIQNIDSIDSPALLIHKERAVRNINHLVEMVKDVSKLRPHVKTNKSADTIQLMMEAGIQKYKCATIAEAEMLGDLQVSDVLLAYQPVGPNMQRFAKLVTSFPNTIWACLIDNVVTAQALGKIAVEQDITISVYIDLNIGMNRTGIAAVHVDQSWLSKIKAIPGIELKGLHVYDGHINNPELSERIKLVDKYFPEVLRITELLKAADMGFNWVFGGSPTFPIHSKKGIAECSPGTFVFWDRGYMEVCPEQDFLPAAVLATRVISIIDDTHICLDLGYKSIASENPLGRRVYFLNEIQAKPVGHSEEHMVIEIEDSSKYQIGDVWYALPIHICPTLALYNDLKIVTDGKWSETWKITSRIRKLTI